MADSKVLAIIPARYASTRFPGKPLVLIEGKPMIQRVWEQAQKANTLDHIVIATDDDRIAQAAQQFGAIVKMTSPHHPSGTDRIWEVASSEPDYDLVFNIQGDEPFLDPDILNRAVTDARQNPQADIITAVTPIQSESEFHDPNIVKAVIDGHGRALYFSRAPIPFCRDSNNQKDQDPLENTFRHLGLYLYRRSALARFTQLPPSPLELREKLEQLRALEAGMTLRAITVAHAPVGIDTPEDLARL